jgi:Uma2 family endonuclease
MGTAPFDLIEEFQTEDIMSVNHSKIIHRLSVALDKYDGEYEILPELELELSAGKCKPDICVYQNFPDDWENDIIFYSKPPIIAIEIQSPKQATTELTDKMNMIYFPSGVKSVWIIVPVLQLVTIRTFDGKKLVFTEGVIKDPVTSIEILFSKIFK